jgi:hypothetical protein
MPDHLFVVLGDAWDGSICNDKLKTAFAFVRKADAVSLRDRLVEFEEGVMQDEMALDGRAPSASHKARVDADFRVARIEIAGGETLPTVFGLLCSAANDESSHCFAGLFLTAAQAEADAPRIKANMLSAFDTPEEECMVTVAACPVLATLPAAPFRIPRREGYSFSDSPGNSSGSQ